jgi:hypothetical protein
VSLACVWISARRALRLKQGIGSELELWIRALRSARPAGDDRLARAAAREPGLAALLDAVASAPSRAAAIAELNDRAGELSRDLAVGAEVPRVAARIALAAGTACAVIAVAGAIGESTSRALLEATFAFCSGLAGAGGSAAFGRLADKRSARHRDNWAELRRAIERSLPA